MKKPFPQALPLRLLLTVPFVALVLGLAATIGLLSYQAGSRAVSTVADHLLLETVGRIGQAVDRHIVGSGATLEAAFPDGMPAPEDISTQTDRLRTRFWIATSLHIDPNNYVYYGNRAGQNIGLFRHSLQDGELRLKTRAADNRTRFRFHGIDGQLHVDSRENLRFDPRERPWFKAGETTKSDTWTSVYIDFGTRELVATRARRVLSARGQFEGVVGTDISLRALNDFVRALKVSSNGFAFIIEPDGKLIASSASANLRRLADGRSVRMLASESGNERQSEAFREVLARLSGSSARNLPQTLSFEGSDGETLHVAFDRVKDNAGLEWITVVAMPRSDFMVGVTENVLRTTLIGVFAALLAVLIGLRILVSVSGDLQRLAEAARDVGEGRFDTPLKIARRDEIGALAQCFDRMRHGLQTDGLTGLANHDSFVRHVNRRIARYRGRPEEAFAVLFVDLNHFKLINDRFGHDAGDRALVEVSRRLEAVVRPGDFLARYAGDEFVILLDGISDPQAIRARCAKITAVLADPLAATGPDAGLEFGAAVGHARFPGDGIDASSLLKAADDLMYGAKA